MNVRKATGTVVSILVLIVGIHYLLPILFVDLPDEIRLPVFQRFNSYSVTGGYHSLIIKFSGWLIIIAAILDAVLNSRAALGFLSSLKAPLSLGGAMVILAFVPDVNTYLSWTFAYLCAILGMYWSFSMMAKCGFSERKKLIPFIKTVRLGVGEGESHVIDRYAAFAMSALLVAIYLIALISFAIYIITHWSALL